MLCCLFGDPKRVHTALEVALGPSGAYGIGSLSWYVLA